MSEPTNVATFLGKHAEQLSALIEQQFEPIFVLVGLEIPVRSSSLVTALKRQDRSSAADLARELGFSHQLVLQKAAGLLERGLVVREDDPKDRRRRVFRLTAKGRRQADLLDELSPKIVQVYDELYEELGVNLNRALISAAEALRSRSLEERTDWT